jgi:NADPH:quinone reductase-like Zn-dependent oxidoreductase
VVRVAEVDKPTITDGEVLIKVHATTVNRTDCAFRAGKPFFTRFLTELVRPWAAVLGGEFAGVVEAVGSGVKSVKVGDRMFGYSEGSWGVPSICRCLRTVRSRPCGERDVRAGRSQH